MVGIGTFSSQASLNWIMWEKRFSKIPLRCRATTDISACRLLVQGLGHQENRCLAGPVSSLQGTVRQKFVAGLSLH